jgi:hypothetical protein
VYEARIYITLKTNVADSPVAEWATVRNGKIAAIRVFLDARPFSAMLAQPGG